MAGLSPVAQDRLFLFGIAFGACATFSLMRRLLIHYRDAAVLTPPENKPQYITQEVEDSLKVTTLNKLLDSPNFCIQETASIIICERALYDDSSIDTLLHYITRPDYATRENGVRTLAYLMNSSSPSTIRQIHKPATWAALVKSLEYSLTDYEHNPYDIEWDNWSLRDALEQECLTMLSQLVDKFGLDYLIKARFVERWLAKEPWGDDESQRQINFLESLRILGKLNDLTLPLIRDSEGRRELCKARLLPFDFEWDTPSPRDTRMTNGEGTAGEDFDGMFVGGRRQRDQSSEGEHIRRRHREAMVLNDGTRPLGREDIIERER